MYKQYALAPRGEVGEQPPNYVGPWSCIRCLETTAEGYEFSRGLTNKLLLNADQSLFAIGLMREAARRLATIDGENRSLLAALTASEAELASEKRMAHAQAKLMGEADTQIEELLAECTALKALSASLWQAIQHGDAEHRAWLNEAISAHFAGQPIPTPRGSGNKEAVITSLQAELDATFELMATKDSEMREANDSYMCLQDRLGASFDEITALKAEVAGMRTLLKPFAGVVNTFDNIPSERLELRLWSADGDYLCKMNPEDFRHALEAASQ